MALGCAVQLEDDLTDLEEDQRLGRKTIPLLFARQAPDVAEASSRVLIDNFYHEAAHALARLEPQDARSGELWSLLPAAIRAS